MAYIERWSSKHVALGNGKMVYQFGAVDYFTRKRVVALAPRLGRSMTI